jgi:hypothetical protein
MRAVLGRRGLPRLACLLAAASLTALAHSRMDPASRTGLGVAFVPRPEQARISSLGFAALVADFHWLHAVQVVGGAAPVAGERASLVARLIDVVTSLDPWVEHAYRFAAVWLTESPGNVHAANRLLARGIAYHPLDWRNRHYLGFNLFFYLSEEEKAAEILAPAVSLPGAPNYLGALVARLRLRKGGLEATAAFLGELARDTADEYKRAEYLKVLDEIQVERWARGLDAARTEYRHRTGRDVAAVADLVLGARPVLAALPPAHPHFPGFVWRLDPDSGRIVSSFYGRRYELHIHPFNRARRDEWRTRAGDEPT